MLLSIPYYAISWVGRPYTTINLFPYGQVWLRPDEQRRHLILWTPHSGTYVPSIHAEPLSPPSSPFPLAAIIGVPRNTPLATRRVFAATSGSSHGSIAGARLHGANLCSCQFHTHRFQPAREPGAHLGIAEGVANQRVYLTPKCYSNPLFTPRVQAVDRRNHIFPVLVQASPGSSYGDNCGPVTRPFCASDLPTDGGAFVTYICNEQDVNTPTQ